MENEKTGCTSPLEIEGPILCVNSCGFFGNPTNMNMCSQCYKDAVFKLEQIKPSASSIEQQVVSSRERAINVSQPSKSVDEIFMKNRCTACKKRVGLTAAFKCRCGDLFCGSHRYSDKHECPFDYRTAGRDAIAKANPVVKAEKLDKI